MKTNLLIIFIFSFLFTSCIKEKTALNFNMQQGKTYGLEMVTVQNITQTIMNTEQKIKNEMNVNMKFKVIQKDTINKFYDLEVWYEKIKMSINSDNFNIDMDSEQAGKTDNIFANMMNEMLNKPFHIYMTEKGKIDSISNIDTLFSTLFNSIPDIGQDSKDNILQSLLQNFGSEAFTGSFESLTALFPEKEDEIQVGKKWENTIVSNAMLNFETKTQWKLDKFNNDGIYLTGKAEIKTLEGDSTMAESMYNTRYELNGTQTSSFVLNPVSKWIKEGTVSQQVKGKVFANNPMFGKESVEWPMTFTTETVYKGIEY
jgi:hypothetical protein